MVNWLACMFKGRHQYSVWCEDGEMFLRCMNCGRRSQGWQVSGRTAATVPVEPATPRKAPPMARLSVVRPD
jgi:hypothetical protein